MNKEPRMGTAALIVAGLAIGLGFAVAGYEIGEAVRAFRAADRYVTVKGLAERTVVADRAAFSIHFNTSAMEFDVLQTEIERNLQEIRAFAKRQGLDAQGIDDEQTVVTDHHANPYTMQHGGPRYTARGGLIIRTANVERVEAAADALNELVKQGILLEPSRPTFAFTGLNAIKPQMLAEATANAKRAAEEFARASQSSVGSMRRANQGVFSIAGADETPAEGEGGYGQDAYSRHKTVRVVTTIEFFLD